MTMTQHCFQRMQGQVDWLCTEHQDLTEGADSLSCYSLKFNTYGLRIQDRGSSSTSIEFCPWSGTKLLPRPGLESTSAEEGEAHAS
jgi:hypothetical protein